jgi:hypothetical protein
MKLKIVTALIILTNSLTLYREIPNLVTVLVFIILTFSFLIKQSSAKMFFKILFLTLGLWILKLKFPQLLVTECAVSFVLILSALKFWELQTESDHFSMFLIFLLSECSILLLNNSFFIFLFGLTKVLFYFYYILKMKNYEIEQLNFKRILILILPSMLFALLMYFTFPRFTSGFITSNELQYILSGGSSRLNIKDLGPFNLSTDQAFKVYGLENSQLPFQLLYWKNTVLWQFHKGEWLTSYSNIKEDQASDVPPLPLKYEIELFQNYKEYLPTLVGQSSIIKSTLPFNKYQDGSFKLKSVSRAKENYMVSGLYGNSLKTNSPLMLKKGLNITSQKKEELSNKFRFKVSLSLGDEERFKLLIEDFKNNGFTYSVSPAIYNSLEDFILSGKIGYCSHFASAFAFLARFYNLPSRVVLGYLGGEFNPFDQSVIIKEMDSHAWVEIYLEKKGWVKFDPTSIVAPERLQLSAKDFNNHFIPYYNFLGLKLSKSYFEIKILNDLNLWTDSVNSRVSNSIVNFDKDKQSLFLKKLIPKKLPIGFAFVLSLILSLLSFWIIFQYKAMKSINREEARYLRFIKKMRKNNVVKLSNETATQFCNRAKSLLPEKSDYIDEELTHYLKSFYK